MLVDAGAGALWGASAGRLAANLHAAGVAPDAVDTVLMTHLHGDHVGGLLDSAGAPALPPRRPDDTQTPETRPIGWTTRSATRRRKHGAAGSTSRGRHTAPYRDRLQRLHRTRPWRRA